PEQRRLEGNVVVRYKVLKSDQILQIDLQPPLVIDSVLQDGRKLSFIPKGKHAYMISVQKPQLPNTFESINVYYSGHPIIAKDPPWEGGFQFTKDLEGNNFVATSCQGLGASAWWPNKDHSYDEPDSMLMSITVPDPLIDVSNGRSRGIVKNINGTTTYNWFVSNPINNYGVNVNAAKYVHFSDTLNGEGGVLDLDYYVLPYNLEKAKEHFKQAKLMLRAFEHWFGPYPFYRDGYKLVETPYLGMEHQSSVTYGNGYQNGYLGKDLSYTGWGLKWDFIIVHESGHEWFANNITYQDIADMWIHEGFTNYSESLFTEYYYGKDAGTDYVVGTRQDIKNDIPIIGIYNVNQRGSDDMYPKGGNMLHTIRHSIGNDSLFREILRGLNKTFYHQTVTSKQVEDFISEKAGIDFSRVFDQYLRTVKIPELQYYVKGKKTYYRWTNVVDNFDLQLITPQGSGYLRLQTAPSWTKVKGKKGESLIDKSYLERMYYIKVTEMTR
ncbi:MAG TPA: M1 family metallopeptidase, partial [Chryseolinea sp.]|nr:M1 family metallopeptidase [Chryseolinea sp.]